MRWPFGSSLTVFFSDTTGPDRISCSPGWTHTHSVAEMTLSACPSYFYLLHAEMLSLAWTWKGWADMVFPLEQTQ